MMNLYSIKEIFSFILGFALSTIIVVTITRNNKILSRQRDAIIKKDESILTNYVKDIRDLYETKLSDKLYNEIRILCLVFTHPDNHKTKVPYVKNTWGKSCNKLIFMSTKNDTNIPEIVALNHENGRSNLWKKTRLALEYVYENHFDDADWFLRADDDKYVSFIF